MTLAHILTRPQICSCEFTIGTLTGNTKELARVLWKKSVEIFIQNRRYGAKSRGYVERECSKNDFRLFSFSTPSSQYGFGTAIFQNTSTEEDER